MRANLYFLKGGEGVKSGGPAETTRKSRREKKKKRPLEGTSPTSGAGNGEF